MSTITRNAKKSESVQKSGDTMTGLLVLSGDPAAELGAATKQYVDATSGVPTLGATWMTSLTSDAASTTGTVACSATGQYVVTAGATDYIYTSSDYGKTWTQRDSSRAWADVCCSSSGDKMAAVVAGGYIYTSTDYGATWTQRDSTRGWYGIACSDDGTKLVASVTGGGSLYYSSDSGATWTSASTSGDYRFVAMSGDGTYAVATVNSGTLYVSADSGATWTSRDSSRTWIDCAVDLDGNVMLAITTGGVVYRSTDNGATWSSVDSTLVSGLSVSVSSDGVYAVASGNVARKSTDSGANWSSMGLPEASSRIAISDAFDYAFYRTVNDAGFTSVEMPSANFIAAASGSGTDYTLTGSYATVDFGTNEARAYVPTAGYYLVYACVQIQADAGGSGDVILAKVRNTTQSTDIGTAATVTCRANSAHERVTIVAATYLAAGDIRIQAYNSTSARGTVISTGTSIGLVKIG